MAVLRLVDLHTVFVKLLGESPVTLTLWLEEVC